MQGRQADTRTRRLAGDEIAVGSEIQVGPMFQYFLAIELDTVTRMVPLFENQEIVVGRDSPADVPIDEESLSRQHARLTLLDGKVWVEDLGSTNGTWIEGQRVAKRRLRSGSQVFFSKVPVSIKALGCNDSWRHQVGSHAGFMVELGAEVGRARRSYKNLALLMMRPKDPNKLPIHRWFPMLHDHLREYDWVALYSPITVEILFPEYTADQALDVAQQMAGGQAFEVGIAAFPDHADSSEEMLEVAHRALRSATPKNPFVIGRKSSQARDDAQEDACVSVLQTPSMQQVFDMARTAASSSATVLIVGETGVGKEILAETIHKNSTRHNGQLVRVNCATIPQNLVESELFGSVRGAFTGATTREGLFSAARNGTIFLDEIGELPLSAQPKLLRVLETGCFTRVGDTQEIKVDVRVLAATNRDLEAMCAAGDFREDLFYRINVITVRIPPLRERPDDIDQFARFFMEKANRDHNRSVQEFSDDALLKFRSYRWAGNLRELRNAVERAVIFAKGERIELSDLDERIQGIYQQPRSKPGNDFRTILERFESELILFAYERNHWSRKKVAESLRVTPRTITNKINQYGLREKIDQKRCDIPENIKSYYEIITSLEKLDNNTTS